MQFTSSIVAVLALIASVASAALQLAGPIPVVFAGVPADMTFVPDALNTWSANVEGTALLLNGVGTLPGKEGVRMALPVKAFKIKDNVKKDKDGKDGNLRGRALQATEPLCYILRLTIAPLHLDLLGLVVDIPDAVNVSSCICLRSVLFQINGLFYSATLAYRCKPTG